jgi:2-methylcitrate dehydratase PrpD
VHGVPHLASFEPDAIKDEQTKAMAQKVAVALDPEFDNAHEDYPTRVAVALKDGRTIEKLVVYASGTPKNPMSAGRLRDKFFDCAEHAKIGRGNAEKIAAILDKLGDQSSLGELWPLLRKA